MAKASYHPVASTPQRKETLRHKLYVVIFETSTPAGAAFDILLLLAILVSVLAVVLESVPQLRHRYGDAFRASEYTFTSAFTLEYLLRLAVSPSPVAYATSFFGIVDAASILPTFVDLLVPGVTSMRVVRVLRLLRVFRVLHMSGFMSDADELMMAFWLARRKILLFLSLMLVLVTILGTLVYLVEDSRAGFTSIPTSIYWTIVTVSTVGYGDIAPQSVPGQLIASIMMVLGYAIIAVPVGLLGAEVSSRESVQREQQNRDQHVALTAGSDAAGCEFCRHCGNPLR
ncbi:hypothetical protein AB1Y20_003658 [Prymnesium parvum]|uniref:Ion transport domain-containing protein n=1 Tax=Prymnesium parvum TaxID=97485 RepID=A0AB34J575_PRYPA